MCISASPYVTGFEKSQPSMHTTRRHNFHYQMILSCSCTHQVTIQVGVGTESFPGSFCCGSFLKVVMVSMSTWVVFKWPHLPWTSRQPLKAGCNSPYHWLISSLAMDLATSCDTVAMWSWKWYQCMRFSCFSINIVLPATWWKLILSRMMGF